MFTIDDVVFRPISPGDARLLIAAHDRLSPEARRSRFFRPHPVMTEEEAAYFTNVDHVDREAFVATVEGEIVAVGRYDRVSAEEAEVAVVVGDQYQGHGLGRLLLDRLGARAREVGITRFVADTFGDNRAAVGLLRNWSPDRTAKFDGGFLHFEMEIPVAA